MNAPLDSTKFAAARFNFLEGVADDATLPKIAARLAVKLATKYMRAEMGGVAWPSIRSLCTDLGLASDSAVRKALSAMVAAGHLNAQPVPGATTRYSLTSRYIGDTTPKNEAWCDDTPPIFEADTPPIFEADTPPIFEADTPPIFEATITGQRNPDKETRTMKSGQDSPPTPSRRRRRKPGGKDLLSDEEARMADEQFERFWSAYPRHVGKAEARKAFGKALETGAGSAEITLGAMRYAAEREHEPDPHKREKFTAHPATWLNAGRWHDEPAPPPRLEITPANQLERTPFAFTPSRRMSHFELAMMDIDRD